MISIKEGVKLEGLTPEILLGLSIVEKVFEKYGIEVVITEATGGDHQQGSLHYQGKALDIRSKHIFEYALKEKILEKCRQKLGVSFDMILEGFGEDREHFHVEFDPQG